jgi:uncharacterized protein YacL
VAVGTLIALLFRTVEISRYVDRKVLNRKRIHFYKGIIISCIIAVTSTIICNFIPLFRDPSNYYQWVARALMVMVVVAIITLVFAFTVYKSETRQMVAIFSSLIHKSKENNN